MACLFSPCPLRISLASRSVWVASNGSNPTGLQLKVLEATTVLKFVTKKREIQEATDFMNWISTKTTIGKGFVLQEDVER